MGKKLIDAIIYHFFYMDMYASSRNIGELLLKNGECITTVKDMYVGGIGNFIDVTTPDSFVDCYKYTLNPDFFKSDLFIEFLKSLKNEQVKELSQLKQDCEDIESNINEINKYIC